MVSNDLVQLFNMSWLCFSF